MDSSDVNAVYGSLSPEDQAEWDQLLTYGAPLWIPQAGKQTDAWECIADIVFYGGSAGGGKSELLLGSALMRHERSIIFRREAVQLLGLEERMTQILGTRDGYNGHTHLWRMPANPLAPSPTLEFGSVQQPDDWRKYQGRPHDLIGFDEITHFTEMQFRQLNGWLRSDAPEIRQQVICAGNPPTDADGEWVIRYWAPWLDPNHPNPAKSGELRWYISNEDGEDEELPNRFPVVRKDKVTGKPRMYKPKSRTFIRSSVFDNAYLMATGYQDTLNALPEPFRSQMLHGDFMAGVSDPVHQLIPTLWLKAAQARWTDRRLTGTGVMTAIGFDPARGGTDKSSLAPRFGQWFDRLVTTEGINTSTGPSAAVFVVPHVRNNAPICLDSIGIGASVLDKINELGLPVIAVVGSEGSAGSDKASGKLRFRNRRAEMYWRLREALDPSSQDPIALPPDPELLGDLAAVKFKVVQMGMWAGIQIRSKDEIREALGRSPDKGDSVAMTFVDQAASSLRSSAAAQFKANMSNNLSADWRAN